MTTDDDLRELARRLAADRDRAFPDLVTALGDDLYSGALHLTRNPADAEDVAQEAFVRAYRALGRYGAERIRTLRLRPWLWTIALNLCRNHWRGERRHPRTAAPQDRADPAPGPEEEILAAAMLPLWRDRLAALDATRRTAVVLRHVVGLTYPEISLATGRPESTVRSDVHRGLRRLRAILEEEEP